jgi:muramidase (phage lysozyme)
LHGLLTSLRKLSKAPLVLCAGGAVALVMPLAPARAATALQAEAQAPAAPRIAMMGVAPELEASPRYAMTPERRALLNTIRFSEGTWARGEDIGYRIMFGGGLAPHLERHPDRVNYSGGYASAAAGAYQFMPFTWALATRALKLQGFGPHVQDQAALFLIQRRGALDLADQGQFTPHLAAKLAPEWASFPTLAGRSFYGQPVQRYDLLRRFYEENLAQLRASAVQVAPIASAPASTSCTPAHSLRCQLQSLEAMGPKSNPLGR